MKKLVFTIICIYTIYVSTAQEPQRLALTASIDNNNYDIRKNRSHSNSNNHVNYAYLESVNSNQNSSIVKQLEAKILDYSIHNSNVYDRSEAAKYRVVFKSSNGQLIVNYNNSGVILSTKEKYKNIVVPAKLRAKISQEYPGWVFHSNTYLINYNFEKGFESKYKIQIEKGNQKKTLYF